MFEGAAAASAASNVRHLLCVLRSSLIDVCLFVCLCVRVCEREERFAAVLSGRVHHTGAAARHSSALSLITALTHASPHCATVPHCSAGTSLIPDSVVVCLWLSRLYSSDCTSPPYPVLWCRAQRWALIRSAVAACRAAGHRSTRRTRTHAAAQRGRECRLDLCTIGSSAPTQQQQQQQQRVLSVPVAPPPVFDDAADDASATTADSNSFIFTAVDRIVDRMRNEHSVISLSSRSMSTIGSAGSDGRTIVSRGSSGGGGGGGGGGGATGSLDMENTSEAFARVSELVVRRVV